MHLLLVSHYWEPEQGVVQRRWSWLANAITDAGHELTVVCPPPHYPGGKLISLDPAHQSRAITHPHKGLTVYRTGFREHDKSITSRILGQATVMMSSIFTAQRALKTAGLRGNPIDAVVCTVPALPSAYVAALTARRFKLPLVVELRDAWPEILDYTDDWHDGHRGRFNIIKKIKRLIFTAMSRTAGALLMATIKQARLLITTTQSLAALRMEQTGTPAISVPNTPTPAILDANDEANLARTEGPLNILYAGTVGRAQGLDNAFDALRILADKNVDVQLRIIGGGAHLSHLKERAGKEQLPVEFISRVPFAEMEDNYRWADTILVHLQPWTPMEYTIPSKLFEAMWAEKHVTGVLAGEAAQIVRDSGIGDVATPADPEDLANLWQKLATHRDQLDRRGKGKAWMQTHPSPEESAKKWVETVQRILTNTPVNL